MNIYEEMKLNEDNRNDTSFLPEHDGSLVDALRIMFPERYSLSDMRRAYLDGKNIGFELGTELAKKELSGNGLDLNNNSTDKEFYDKFVALCKEYNARLCYNGRNGLEIVRLEK